MSTLLKNFFTNWHHSDIALNLWLSSYKRNKYSMLYTEEQITVRIIKSECLSLGILIAVHKTDNHCSLVQFCCFIYIETMCWKGSWIIIFFQRQWIIDSFLYPSGGMHSVEDWVFLVAIYNYWSWNFRLLWYYSLYSHWIKLSTWKKYYKVWLLGIFYYT